MGVGASDGSGFWVAWLALSVPALLMVVSCMVARRVTRRRHVSTRLGSARAAGSAEPRPLPGWLARPIDRAALGIAPSRLVAVWGGTVVLAALSGAVTGVVGLGLLAAAGAAVIPAVVLWFLRGPLAADLTDLDRRLGLGQPFGQVLAEWTNRRELAGIRLASAALGFSAESGGSRSRAIDGLADSLRDRAALDREITALASQARMSGVVIAVLPIGFVFVSSTLDPEVSAFLFASPAGLMCLAVGIGLDLVGFLWMHRMSTSIDGAAP